jgi:ParB family chromosome partitioning protein
MVKQVAITNIVEHPDNLRKSYDEITLSELSTSITEVGIKVPLLVRLVGKKFEIVCGHRRFRAAKMAGLGRVPVIVEELADAESRQIQLVENCQREDVSPLDEAAGYKELIERYGIGTCRLARVVGKSKAHILNRLKMLGTPEVRHALTSGKIKVSQAVALLAVRPEIRRKVMKNPGNTVTKTQKKIAEARGLERITCPSCRGAGHILVEEWRSP